MIIRRVILILVVLFLALPGAVLAGEQDLQKAARVFFGCLRSRQRC